MCAVHYHPANPRDPVKEAGALFALPAGELDDFLRQSAPRTVSRAFLNEVTAVSFGMRFPWWIKLLISIFCVTCIAMGLLLTPWNLPVDILMKLGWRESSKGAIVSHEATSYRVTYGGGPELRIYRVNVRFATAAGKQVATAAYVDGEEALPGGPSAYNRSGQALAPIPVDIAYFPPHPEIASFAGARTSVSGALFLVFLIFPVLAAVLPLIWFAKKHRLKRLLVEGTPTIATITGMANTSAVINGQRQYAVSVTFRTTGGDNETKIKALGERANFLRRCQEEGIPLRALYLPEAPEYILLLDAAERPAGDTANRTI